MNSCLLMRWASSCIGYYEEGKSSVNIYHLLGPGMGAEDRKSS